MNYKPIFYINGILLLILAVSMVVPMALDLSDGNPDWRTFAGAQIITTFVGFLLIFTNREKRFHMSIRETFLMTTLSWLSIAAFAAIPFCLADIHLSPTRGFFEAMSGITTTGATVITGLDDLPRGILIWRALLHWLGGIGFLVIALAILPLLQVSGMQIFRSQSLDIEKVLPSAGQMAGYLCFIYVFLTALCAALFHYEGMSWFEAACHAMSTISTGGFSTSDASIGHFNSPLIEYTAALFMLLGGMPFLLYLRAGRGDFAALLKDVQVQAFLGFIIFFSIILAAYLALLGPFWPSDALRHAIFKVVTLMTTTGFVTQDYSLWGPFAIGLAFLITFIGSCSGSTSGGIKIFRIQILWAMLKLQLRKLILPSGVFQAYYNNKPVDMTVQTAVGLFLFIYLASFLIAAVLLMLTGLDSVSALANALSTLSNAGPALGSMISPAGAFSHLHNTALWILSACMLLGRLEIFTVLVIFSTYFWKR